MNYRRLGKTNYNVSEIGFGAWAIGADWGDVTDKEALNALRAAIEKGVSFIDTADVYGDGRSEQRIAQILKDHKGTKVTVASKAGRRLNPHESQGYNYENLALYVQRSLKNLELDSLDLIQLHCPPTDVYRQDDTFNALERLRQEGAIKHYGVSVETVEEAKLALNYEGVATVQIIYNMFRLKPALDFFEFAKMQDVGVIARVPLASGLLSGKMTQDRVFSENDHRQYNRNGEAFDVGETFAGVDFEVGLQAVEELKSIVPEGASLAQTALRWILMHAGVSTVIPGAKSADQANGNSLASNLAPLPPSSMQKVREVYDKYIREAIHHRW